MRLRLTQRGQVWAARIETLSIILDTTRRKLTLNLLQREEVVALDPARYGLTDPEKEYPIDGIVYEPASSQWPFKRIVSHQRAVYVGAIAYEYMHLPDKLERL